MTGNRSEEPERTSPSAGRSHGRPPTNTNRWTAWLLSLLVVGGATTVVAINGSGGATSQVPPLIQVGAARSIRPVHVTTTPPARRPSSPTTTVAGGQRLTTLVRPLLTVTDHEDSSRSDTSSDTNASPLTSASN